MPSMTVNFKLFRPRLGYGSRFCFAEVVDTEQDGAHGDSVWVGVCIEICSSRVEFRSSSISLSSRYLV